jgi:hypothetical protein
MWEVAAMNNWSERLNAKVRAYNRVNMNETKSKAVTGEGTAPRDLKLYWIQGTTGKLHKSRTACMTRGITRCFNAPIKLDAPEFETADKCRRCFPEVKTGNAPRVDLSEIASEAACCVKWELDKRGLKLSQQSAQLILKTIKDCVATDNHS